MLTKLTIRNFKKFEEAEIPLGNGFVFVGANNSGKTSALQALALWHAGLKEWWNRSGGNTERRYGVTINRLDLLLLPVSDANLLWHNKKVKDAPSKLRRMELIVDGITDGRGEWRCGLEFDSTNKDSIHCRPIRAELDKSGMQYAREVEIGLLPPMSGLASEEPLIREGWINKELGQGNATGVLRNICYATYQQDEGKWEKITQAIEKMFGVNLMTPTFRPGRGDIVMQYTHKKVSGLDIQSAGRGMQQVILLLAYLYGSKPGSVLLLDEPDAHLEIVLQGRIYNLLREAAEETNSQIIAASHSEKLLQEAVSSSAVVSFVGKPCILGEGQKKEVIKALVEIDPEHYYLAEQHGFMLYLEGKTDGRILRAFAEALKHPAWRCIEESPIIPIGDDVPRARRHFSGLLAAKPNLVGVVLTDRSGSEPQNGVRGFTELRWEKCEIENYLCSRKALVAYAKQAAMGDLFVQGAGDFMDSAIAELQKAGETFGKPDMFSPDIKASDDFLVPLFRKFAQDTKTPVLRKGDFFKIARHIPKDEIGAEVKKKLDTIHRMFQKAKPRRN